MEEPVKLRKPPRVDETLELSELTPYTAEAVDVSAERLPNDLAELFGLGLPTDPSV